jgi:hypothetical protein
MLKALLGLDVPYKLRLVKGNKLRTYDPTWDFCDWIIEVSLWIVTFGKRDSTRKV